MACGQGIQLRLDVIASAGHGSVLQGAGGHQLIQRASPGLHLLGLVLSALHGHPDVAHLLGDPADRLPDVGLCLGGGVGGFDGFLAGPERIHLRRQPLRGEGELVLLRLQGRLLALQVGDLGGYRRPADQRRTSEILVPGGERLLRLVLQFAGRQLQLGELQFDALAAGGHVRQPAAHLLHHLKLLLIGVIENLAGILGAVQRLIRLCPEQGGDTAADAHPGPLPLTGWRPWPDGTSGASRPAARQPLPSVPLSCNRDGVGIALLGHLSRLGIGVSSFVSVGDKYDVSPNDMLMWWEQDDVTRLVFLYVESFGNPRKFARRARRVGQRMPVLTVVGGRSAAGQRAAVLHTAAAGTPLVTQEALFGQAGIIATASLGELIEAAALLACQPLPAGNRVAIVSNTGGAGVLAADACGDNGLQVTQLGSATQRRLRRLLPAGAVVAGPVDTTAAVTTDSFRACLEAVAADDRVDAVLAVAVPTAISDPRTAVSTAAVSKPIAAALLDQAESVRLLPAEAPEYPQNRAAGAGAPDGPTAGVAGLPAYAYPEDAARALGHAARYRAWRERQQGRIPELSGLRGADARKLLAGFLADCPAGGWLPAATASELLSCYQVPLVVTLRAGSEQEATQAAAQLGGRVVLKAETGRLAQKSDAGAVRLDLRTPQEVAGAYRALAAGFGSSLTGVLVQPMLAGGVEVLIGVVQEPVFGPLVVFGLGGAATEVPGDHAARLAPLTDADAYELIHAAHAAPPASGHRGTPVDTAALADTLLRVSRLADDLPEVAELNLSPVIAGPVGVCAVDVRVRVSPAEPRDPFLRRLR